MRQPKWYVHLREKFWFIPTIYGLFSLLSIILLSYVISLVPQSVYINAPSSLLITSATANSLYSGLITALLTMTSVSFSSVMVVLTTYATQFTPRALQDFMQSRITQHVLGVFTFGIIFTFINLLLVSPADTNHLFLPIIMIAVAIACLAAFILFIYHSTKYVQVNHLIGKIRNDASYAIEEAYTLPHLTAYAEWNESFPEGESEVVRAHRSGYTQLLELENIVNWAVTHDVTLKSLIQVGDYIHKGEPVFEYWPKDREPNIQVLRTYLLVGNERSNAQDIEFSMQKLVDIAIRAISPSVNDPHTALNCINRLAALLAEISIRHESHTYFVDQNDQLRFILYPKSFASYLHRSFFQIRMYGKDDISVIGGCIDALTVVAQTGKDTVRDDLISFAEYMKEAVDEESLSSWDYDYWNERIQKFESILYNS
ncbi:DUF2254 domain-containing protein [Salibacterium salarium]|uniref:DUF2254 domain-containing protein n=1 Tax=Salibacterium salarium TaxID=284579 RepID=A0A428MTT3_9BACI|nr:DUF2254 domain-containing protein [Salibacterium salarium]RSL29555.1 DUF2254 domain-containing protein [Salibacterium salarium]